MDIMWIQKKHLENKQGFTLLEVMIAMTIMAIALTAILTAQDNSINAVTRAKNLNMVRVLAKNKMIEEEYMLSVTDFNAIEKEKTGKFDEPYVDYTFVRTVKEVKFPNFGSIAQSAGGDESANNMTGQQLEMVKMINRMVTDFLSRSVRELTISIHWQKNGKDQSYSVSQYLVNFGNTLSLSQ